MRDQPAATGTAPAPRQQRHWSDWVGFVVFGALAIDTLVRVPQVAVLLLPTFFHELLVALAFLFRRPLRMELQGWIPSLLAYAGTFLLLVFVEVAHAWHPGWIATTPSVAPRSIGLLLWLVGTLLALLTLWHLRRSFSIVPQARALVTTGPYHYARHPIYGAYVLQYSGIWLGHATLPLALVMLAWLAITLARVRFEEAVLLVAFPEYAAYRRSVGTFGPRLLPRRSSASDRP